jgi:cephalosporin-C deacetylase-like acetyl esterase
LSDFADGEKEQRMTAQAIIDVRRAFDVLTARDDIDPERLGFVGHSWGASLGAVLAAVDERPSSLVLIAPRPSWTGFLTDDPPLWVNAYHHRVGDEAWSTYLTAMAPLDATAEIDRVDARRLYLQYGTRDDVIPTDVARQLVNAAEGARVDWYPADHALSDAATADRIGWLVTQFGLTEVPGRILSDVGLPDE